MGKTISLAGVAIAAIVASTVAAWHGAIDGGTFAGIVMGALGIGGGVAHATINTNSSGK